MKKLFLFLFSLSLFTQSYSQKYVQVWGDEFNTPGLPDSTKWDYEVGKMNGELQYYTYKREENIRIQDTVLIIETRKEAFQGVDYTSARILSRRKGDWLYGKFEFSAKVPQGLGIWPAIWMMPTESAYGGWPQSGEIDIMEYVGWNPDALYFTTHYEGTNGSGHQQSGFNTTLIKQPYDQFVKFTLYWTPTKLEWWANDKRYFTYNKPSIGAQKYWPFDKMFYLILNLAYGGWGGQNGLDDAKLPGKFYIDYVRVYQLQGSDGPFSLNIKPEIGGTVVATPDQSSYPAETLVTLTAKPDDGYEFEKWKDLGFSNPMTLKVISDLTVTPVFKKKNELIANGDFSQGLASWGSWTETTANTVFKTSVVDSVFVANITSPGTTNWHIVEQQFNIPLEQGATYSVSFDAWADIPKTMDVFISKNHDDYSEYYSTVKNITTNRKTYTWTFKMLNPSDNSCRFGFGFGQFTGKVNIDNVSILKSVPTNAEAQIESSTGLVIFPNPTSGELNIVSRLAKNEVTTIKLFNIQGQAVSTLCQNQNLSTGQTLQFNLKDFGITRGIYLLTFSTLDKKITRKVIVN